MISLDGDINTGDYDFEPFICAMESQQYAAGCDAALRFDSRRRRSRDASSKRPGFFRALSAAPPVPGPYIANSTEAAGVRLLLVDNEDCFIHTLANYSRQTGAEVMTYRAGFPLSLIETIAPSLILVSPGPGRPEDFGVPAADPPCRETGDSSLRRMPRITGNGGGIRRRTGRARITRCTGSRR